MTCKHVFINDNRHCKFLKVLNCHSYISIPYFLSLSFNKQDKRKASEASEG